MIVAVPEQTRCLFTPMGPANPPPPYWASVTWWHWWCSTCRRTSKPRALFSHAPSALEMGDRHEEREQCQDGQLLLFGGVR